MDGRETHGERTGDVAPPTGGGTGAHATPAADLACESAAGAAPRGRTHEPIPVVLCLDVEPEERLLRAGDPAPWAGYLHAQQYFTALRPRIAAVTGAPARYTWFFRMDPQIEHTFGSATVAVDRFRAFVDGAERAGDEIGLHAHAFRWRDDDRSWLQDLADQSWVDHCVGTSFAAFTRAFGRPCTCFRFGDRWLSTATVDLLERLGVRIDLTVEPGVPRMAPGKPGEAATGALPDYRRVPRAPYEPARADFRRAARPGTRAIRMMPLTAAKRSLVSQLRRLRATGFRDRGRLAPLSLWARWRPPDTFDRLLTRALAAQARPYLAFAVRTELGPRSAIATTVDAALRALLAHPARDRFVFCTPAEALALLAAR